MAYSVEIVEICDRCQNNLAIDCYDCEQYQEARTPKSFLVFVNAKGACYLKHLDRLYAIRRDFVTQFAATVFTLAADDGYCQSLLKRPPADYKPIGMLTAAGSEAFV
jgi:hypothetical protein